MNVKIDWQQALHIKASTQSGHIIDIDGASQLDGGNLGPRPMEMLLVGLGSCTTLDVVSILKKMQEKIAHCQIEISAKRADKHPKVFTDIHLKFMLSGNNLSKEKAKKAIDLSAKKYCSVSIMLGAVANITRELVILDD